VRARPRFLFLLGPLFALALVLWVHARGNAQPGAPDSPDKPREKVPPLPPDVINKPDPPRPPGPQTVTVGLYIQNIHEVDIKSNSFTAEFYLWFRWKGDIDPTLTYEISNVVNIGDLSRVPIYTDAAGAAAVETLPDGAKLQTFHVHGRFGHPFPLAKYPFDAHHIVIAIEDAKHTIDRLVYEIDTAGTAIRPDLTIPGWKRSEVESLAMRSQFATTFGDTRSTPSSEVYSRASFRIAIDRPVIGIVSKTVIPIALILLITFGAFFCQPTDIDARLCLTITALISAVALQITAATELPPTGSLLLLDKIYILSYAAILAVTFCCIAVNRLAHAEQLERAHAVDRWSLRLIAVGYFGGLVLLVVGTR
jgi:hypothetical protein